MTPPCFIPHYPSPISHATFGNSGMILVVVLLFMAIILTLVIHSQVVARMALRFEDRQCQQAQLRVAAAEAAWNALRALAADETLQVDHTNEQWAALQTNRLPNSVETAVTIVDENRYVSVNNLTTTPSNTAVRLPVAIVRDIFTAESWSDPAGETQTLKDWIDPDTEGTREAGYYRQTASTANKGIAIEPPNAPLESPAELAAVLNNRRPEPRKTPAALTVLPGESGRIVPINVNTAGRDTLLAVFGAGHSFLADEICRRRNAYPIINLSDLEHTMDADTMSALRPYLATCSHYFSVVAQAARNEQQETVTALVRRDSRGDIEILRWVYR